MSDTAHDPESLSKEIIGYYDQGKEATRLDSGIGLLELARTKELIRRFAPEPPAVIADIGGGPGTYACWLAGKGYEVHLVDAVALHVEQARQTSLRQPDRQLASCTQGDARQLEFDDNWADIVLLLGPLYHLVEKKDRLVALRECWRTLRPSGLLMAIGISRFASLNVGLVRGWTGDPEFRHMVSMELASGRHIPPENRPGLFTTAYFHQPDELAAEIMEAGFSHLATIAVEGAGWLAPDLVNGWQRSDQREALLEVVRWTESEQSILGISPHIMTVARKERDNWNGRRNE